MAANIPRCCPLHTFPSDVQRLVLNQDRLNWSDLGHLRETCQEEKAMVDRHEPVLLKNALLEECPELKGLIGRYMVIVNQEHEQYCRNGRRVTHSHVANDYQVYKIFDRFQTRFSVYILILLPRN
jgi:hypothetical protein